jgi:hypothetical protein
MKFGFAIILFSFLLSACTKEDLNTAYFMDIYGIKDSLINKKTREINIEKEFMNPFYINTIFKFKKKSRHLEEIVNLEEKKVYGENIIFYRNSDCISIYKFNNIDSTYSYAMYFDEKGKLVKTEGNIRVDFIPMRNSDTLFEIEILFSKFYYDNVVIKMKNEIQDEFIKIKTNNVAYSPFIVSVSTDLRNKRSKDGSIYFAYELAKGNMKIYTYDTVNYSGSKVW